MAFNHWLSSTAALAFGLLPAAGLAQSASIPLPAGTRAGPCVEEVCEYRLGNELRVLLIPDDGAAAITVNLVYLVGSADESPGESGMAHLLEHMLFKGTAAHPDISSELLKRGIAFAASTRYDATQYRSTFLPDAETLDGLLALEADRMTGAALSREQLAKEVEVVRDEMKQGEDDPERALTQALMAAAYRSHPYGRRIIGASADIGNATPERMRAFYRNWYRPDNAVLIVAGRIDPGATLDAVARRFGGIAKPEAPMQRARTPEPAQAGEREVVLDRGGQSSRLAIAYHIPAATHADTAALQVLADIMQSTSPVRAYAAVFDTGQTIDFDAHALWMRDPSLWTAATTIKRGGDIGVAERTLLDQLERLDRAPIRADEVASAKDRLRRGYERTRADVGDLAMALTEAIGAGDWRLYFRHRDAIGKATAEQVNQVAGAYLRPANRSVGRLLAAGAPQPVAIPEAPTPAKALHDYRSAGEAATTAPFDASIANLQARTRYLRIGAGRELRVALLPRKRRDSRVVVDATFLFADAGRLRGRGAAAMVAGSLLGNGYVNGPADVRAELDSIDATLRLYAGPQSATLFLDVPRKNLAKALLLAERSLRAPTFADRHVRMRKETLISAILAAQEDPAEVAAAAMAAHFESWPEGHPYRSGSAAENLAAIGAVTPEQVRAYPRDVYGTAEGTIGVVGDFDPVEVERWLRARFAGWKASRRYVAARTACLPVAPERRWLPTPGKRGGALLARANIALNDNAGDALALTVADRILGGHAINSRLGRAVRDRGGLSYSVASSLVADRSADARDDTGSWTISATAAPHNLAKLERLVRGELERLLRDGVSPDEVREATGLLLAQRRQARHSNADLANLLANTEFRGKRLESIAEQDRRLSTMTSEEVDAAIRKYLKPDRFSFYLAGDPDSPAKSE